MKQTAMTELTTSKWQKTVSKMPWPNWRLLTLPEPLCAKTVSEFNLKGNKTTQQIPTLSLLSLLMSLLISLDWRTVTSPECSFSPCLLQRWGRTVSQKTTTFSVEGVLRIVSLKAAINLLRWSLLQDLTFNLHLSTLSLTYSLCEIPCEKILKGKP